MAHEGTGGATAGEAASVTIGEDELDPIRVPRRAGDVGAGVEAILRAAEEAAERIEGQARRHATELMRNTEEAVAARLQELTHDAERIREQAEAEANDMRLAVEAYGTRRRREADEEARAIVAEAEQRARQLVATAEERAREAVEANAVRARELEAQVRALETKRQKASDAVRRIVAHLEDALVEAPQRTGPASLEHALDVQSRTRRLTH